MFVDSQQTFSVLNKIKDEAQTNKRETHKIRQLKEQKYRLEIAFKKVKLFNNKITLLVIETRRKFHQ